MLASSQLRELIPQGSRGIVALSGGPDSLCLLHVLATAAIRGDFAICAVHVDHGIRADSWRDVDRVRQLSRALGVRLVERRAVGLTQGGGNLQERARLVRRELLVAEAKREGADWIALGHTADDQAETVVMRMMRGAGARGLSGMAQRSGPFVRPLLRTTRVEIELYLEQHNLVALRDPSNESRQYLRNRIRQSVLPVLRQENPEVGVALCRLADNLREDEEALAALAHALWCANVVDGRLQLEALRIQPPAIIHRVLAIAYADVCGSQTRLSRDHLKAVAELVRGDRGTQYIDLPRGIRAERAYSSLEFRRKIEMEQSHVCIEVPQQGRWLLGDGRAVEVRAVESADGRIDIRDQGIFPLEVRAVQAADRLSVAAGAHKRVNRLLSDAKVPRARRSEVLVAAHRGEVIAVIGMRAAFTHAASGGCRGLRIEIANDFPHGN